MNIITDTIDQIRAMKVRRQIYQALTFGVIVAGAVMIWNFLKLVTLTESPIVVVLSGSMEPSMYRGDILLLHKRTTIENGDIIVYNLPGEGIPIVHRIILKQKADGASTYKYLTKGDNNYGDDRPLYGRGSYYINEDQVVGKVAGILPYGGYFTIILNDYPMAKFLMLGSMLLSVMISKDQNQ